MAFFGTFSRSCQMNQTLMFCSSLSKLTAAVSDSISCEIEPFDFELEATFFTSQALDFEATTFPFVILRLQAREILSFTLRHFSFETNAFLRCSFTRSF